jgi:hypothetical protein
MDNLLQFANQVKRGCRHLWKAARRLNAVRESLQRNPDGKVVESETPDTQNIAKIQKADQTIDSEKGEEAVEKRESGDNEVESSSPS